MVQYYLAVQNWYQIEAHRCIRVMVTLAIDKLPVTYSSKVVTTQQQELRMEEHGHAKAAPSISNESSE